MFRIEGGVDEAKYSACSKVQQKNCVASIVSILGEHIDSIGAGHEGRQYGIRGDSMVPLSYHYIFGIKYTPIAWIALSYSYSDGRLFFPL